MHLDTHVVAWLHRDGGSQLPRLVRARIDRADLVVSPMVWLELDLLHEIGRTAAPAAVVATALRESLGLHTSPTAFTDVVAAAAPLAWTRDPFDRLICANALVDGVQLLTRDQHILDHLGSARWD